MTLEVGCKHKFGELKAGDKFVFEGIEYEKISGNCADRLMDQKVVDIEPDAVVYLYEQ